MSGPLVGPRGCKREKVCYSWEGGSGEGRVGGPPPILSLGLILVADGLDDAQDVGLPPRRTAGRGHKGGTRGEPHNCVDKLSVGP